MSAALDSFAGGGKLLFGVSLERRGAAVMCQLREASTRQPERERFMKAVTWHGKRNVRVDTVSDPTIEQPTHAIVRIKVLLPP